MTLTHDERTAVRLAIDRRCRERLGINACEFALADLLVDGPRPAVEVWAALAGQGFGRDTISSAVCAVVGISKNRARTKCGVYEVAT